MNLLANILIIYYMFLKIWHFSGVYPRRVQRFVGLRDLVDLLHYVHVVVTRHGLPDLLRQQLVTEFPSYPVRSISSRSPPPPPRCHPPQDVFRMDLVNSVCLFLRLMITFLSAGIYSKSLWSNGYAGEVSVLNFSFQVLSNNLNKTFYFKLISIKFVSKTSSVCSRLKTDNRE